MAVVIFVLVFKLALCLLSAVHNLEMITLVEWFNKEVFADCLWILCYNLNTGVGNLRNAESNLRNEICGSRLRNGG